MWPPGHTRANQTANKRTDSHVASLLGMTENNCHCEEAPGRRGNPHPPSPLQGLAEAP